MADKSKTTGKTKQRAPSDRREGDRRQEEHKTMKVLFDAYGFEEERKSSSRRTGKERRGKD